MMPVFACGDPTAARLDSNDEVGDTAATDTGESGTDTLAGDGDGGGGSTTDDDGSTTTSGADTATGDGSTSTGEGNDSSVPQADPQCDDGYYFVLDRGDRNRMFNDGDGGIEWCDRMNGDQVDVQWAGSNWYRFMGAAGTHMPELPPLQHSCGTEAPGWLNGKHPKVGEPPVTREVCFSWSDDTCQWKKDIQVVACGGYYLYYLDDTITCGLRYCGTD